MSANYTNGASRTSVEGNPVDREKSDRLNLPGLPRTAEAIQDWLVARLCELLGIETSEIDVREPFASYGLGSTEMVILSGELADWLGQQLSPSIPYEYPTIEALARHLARVPDASGSASTADDAPEALAEPIAIIGIGCRFPGASSPQAFWQLMREGVDAITEVPAERFSLPSFYDPDPAAPGKMNTRWGGFLQQVDRFDAPFFGISPREAARMDPQQRLLLEVAWEALQDAGQVAERLAATRTGVFIGISNNDYGRMQFGDPLRIDAYAGTGNALSIAANRISYVFDLRGPSIAIDTACSSSLVAVHMACRSLCNGESTLALAGGVNLILSPAITINFSKAGVMAPDGRCKTFDARADGYVRSEGAGVVVLKPLSKALADADPIYAVVLGSAVNQDGRSNGLMAPNPLAQEAVLREAYRRARVSPGDVQYVEAHGTGTLLGDPIEVTALGAVMGIDRPAERPCAIGSVKTNIGHLEAAAGIAGLIKVALALKHREIPPNLHFTEPNPHIPFDRLPLRVQTTLAPWPIESAPSLAGVSSFGFGGTNAHVVLREALGSRIRSAEHRIENGDIRGARSGRLLPLSAQSPDALRSLARAYQDFLTIPESDLSLYDICYTASARRGHQDYRLAVSGDSREQLTDGLQAFLQGESRPGLSSGRKDSGRRRKLVFVFPGQGSQWLGMGRTLAEQEPVFREVMERCDRAMRPYGDWSLLAELLNTDGDRSRLGEVDVLQPALFAIQTALTALWRSWSVEPAAVVGHSMGEVAAAHVAGVLSLEDAAKVVCSRSRIVKSTIGKGAMAAVGLSIADARHALADFEDRVSIAVSNGSTSTVLSGDPEALEVIVDRLQRQEIFGRMIKVDFAAHSPQMEPLCGDLRRALEGLQPRSATVPIYSTVTGKISDGLSFDPAYWTKNLREPVLFSTAVHQLLEDGYDTFLEVSPHPALLSSIQEEFRHSGKAVVVLPSLRRDEDERKILAGSLGTLYTSGYPIEWSRVYPEGGRCVQLPLPPWQRERCWMESEVGDYDSQWERVPHGTRQKHPLLGRHFKAAYPAGTHFWEGTLDKRVLPYLNDHRIEAVAVLPASAYVEMALAAAAEAFGAQPFAVKDIEFHRALFLPDDARSLQLVFSSAADNAASFQIYSRPAGLDQSSKSWTLHVTGKVSLQAERSVLPALHDTMEEIQAQAREKISGPDYYAKLSEHGIDYGHSLQSITQLWRHNREVLAEVRIPEGSEFEFSTYRLHPASLDAGLQAAGAAISHEVSGNDEQQIFVPTHIDEIRIHGRPGPHLWSYARLEEQQANTIEGEVRLLDDTGHAVVEMFGLHFNSLGGSSQRALEENLDDWLYEFQWQPAPRLKEQTVVERSTSGIGESWLIFGDRDGVGNALAQRLETQGARSILVSRGASYDATDNTHFSIRPNKPEDLRKLFDTVLSNSQSTCRAIIHLWSLDAPAPQDITLASLIDAQSLGCESVLQLVQELARIESGDPPRLWLVTRGAQPVGEGPQPLDVAQAPLWGLGRVIAQEHAALWGGLIDLELGVLTSDTDAQQLWEQIRCPDQEDQLAFREGRRFVGRLVRRPPSALQYLPLALRTDGSYLITGGLGDLGLAVARWMVERGARRLILLGRTKLPPRASWSTVQTGSRLAHQVGAIRELEALGASVYLASVDVADEGQLSAFVNEYRSEGWPPIRGVVHAAGMVQDGLLLQLDRSALNAVLRPKVMGGWLLHHLFENAPLDFFVLFSSAGSLLGQPGQGNYAAANAFLDALAHHRRAQHQPALTMNWSAWADLGFADTTGGKRLAARLALVGISSMLPAQALEVLERMLQQGATQVAAVPVNWARYREFYSAVSESPLLSILASERADVQPQVEDPAEKRQALLVATPAVRQQLLQSYLSEQVARVLGCSVSKLDLEQPLSNLGLDSLMAVELKNRISIDLGVNVPMVKFLQGPSVSQATAQILDQLTAETSTSQIPLTPAAARYEEETKNDGSSGQTLVSVDQLSDEEVNSLLIEMLDKADISQ
jgi:acyl transferase domain-containing protein/acyl carrier protein